MYRVVLNIEEIKKSLLGSINLYAARYAFMVKDECVEYVPAPNSSSFNSENDGNIKPDLVNHPAHYAAGKIEVIEAIEDWFLGFNLGNTVKYVARAGKKDPSKEIEDLEKARWYLSRQIELLKSKNENREKIRPNEMNR